MRWILSVLFCGCLVNAALPAQKLVRVLPSGEVVSITGSTGVALTDSPRMVVYRSAHPAAEHPRRLQEVDVIAPADRAITSASTDNPKAIVPAFFRDACPVGAFSPGKPQLQELLKKYREACATKDLVKAKRLASLCLEIDPTCFEKK